VDGFDGDIQLTASLPCRSGVSNDFLVASSDTLALRYNDATPHENHHVASAFLLLRDPRLNFMSKLTRSQWQQMRRLVIELVLATE